MNQKNQPNLRIVTKEGGAPEEFPALRRIELHQPTFLEECKSFTLAWWAFFVVILPEEASHFLRWMNRHITPPWMAAFALILALIASLIRF